MENMVSVKVEEDFFGDINRFIIDLFPSLSEKHWKDNLLTYYNWNNRLIYPKPREILYSKEIKENALFERFEESISNIHDLFEKGKDLTPYLSKGFRDSPVVDNPTSSTKDKDLLLNDWGIHHLHLGDILEQSGFIKRENELLFIKVKTNKVFFIDILTHDNFSDKHILSIIDNNWPDIIDLFRLRNAIDVNHDYTNSEIGVLRKAGVNTILKINNSVVSSPNFGITTSGHSISDVGRTSNFHKNVLNLKKSINDNKKLIQSMVFKDKRKKLNTLKIKLLFDNTPWLYPFKVIEEQSDYLIEIFHEVR